MKFRLSLLVFSLLIIAAIGASGCDSLTPTGGTTSSDTSSQQATGIWVSGTGTVSVTPDIAVLQVGVEVQDATVAEAQIKATTAMNAILATLKNSGIEDKDIQTRYLRISERTRWDDETNQSVVIGYYVTNSATAKIRETDRVADIIDDVVAAGGDAVRIDNLYFTVDDPTAYYDDARTEAMTDARDKAEKLADLADVRLGSPTYIAESTSATYPYESQSYALGGLVVPAPSVDTSSVSPGEVEVTLTIQVAYSMY